MSISTIQDEMLKANLGVAKAWVNFNGQGTVAIRSSHNVSSITDNSTGIHTINFTNNMTDVDYSVVGTTGLSDQRVLTTASYAVDGFVIHTQDGGVFEDQSYLNLVVFGN